jgi:exodeoxyribonuclease VII large subunit
MARDEIAARIAGLTEDLANAMRYRLIEHRSRLAELESSRAFDEVEMAIHATAQRFDEAAHRMELALGAAFKARRADLAAVMLRLREADIRRAMTGQRGRLEVLSERLESFARATINNQREKFSVAVAKLESLSPLAVLGRGYAIAFDSEGRVIKRATDVGAGSRIRVRVAEGEIECEKI